jgi:hypothetical protein
MVQEAARIAGARLALVGDTEQLGAVEAGGMFRLLAREVPCAELHEVRRFDASWEAGASVRLRAGDFTACAAYDRHGRMRGADQDPAMDRAAGMWLADHLRGKHVMLLAGLNSEAAELSRRIQAKLIQLGTSSGRRLRCRTAIRPGPATDPGPAQHQDQRAWPGADQPRDAEGHRLEGTQR